nr:protein IWS1 homolog [Onthophagus taurus]
MSGISDEVWEDFDMVLNRRERFSRLSRDLQQLTEDRLAAFFASENIEGEEDDPFGGDDADEDYIPPDEAASDAEEKLHIEKNVTVDSDDSDEEEEEVVEGRAVTVNNSQLPVGEFYTSKDGVVWMKNPPARYRPHANNVSVVASENIEDEEDDPFAGDDADEDYIPPDEAASDAEEKLHIEKNVAVDSDDSDEEEEEVVEGQAVTVNNSQLPVGEFYTSKDGVVWMKNPPARYRPHANNVSVVASENIEDEEDDPFAGDDADEDYIPPDEAASDAEEKLHIEKNVAVDSDDSDEEEERLGK